MKTKPGFLTKPTNPDMPPEASHLLKRTKTKPLIRENSNLNINANVNAKGGNAIARQRRNAGGKLGAVVATTQDIEQKRTRTLIPIPKHNESSEGGEQKKTQKTPPTSEDEKMGSIHEEICEKYEVGGRLGKGAYGIVWKAKEVRTGNEIALKKIFDAFRNNQDAQRTYREIIFLREFSNHPNIITFIRGHRDPNNMDLYLTFNLMETDLYRVIKGDFKRLHEEEDGIAKIFYQILKAIKYIHSADVIHRDLKPANILLDKFFNVKLADFGLSRSIIDLDINGTNSCSIDESGEKQCNTSGPLTEYVATRWYRAPEILLACPRYGKPSDMWSLGCILAEMLRGKALFTGDNTQQQKELVFATISVPNGSEDLERAGFCSAALNEIVKSTVRKRKSLAETLQDFDKDAVDIIENLLVFTPKDRLTVEEVLNQAYLERIRNVCEEITCDHLVHPPISDFKQLSLAEYRDEVHDLIKSNKIERKSLPFPKPTLQRAATASQPKPQPAEYQYQSQTRAPKSGPRPQTLTQAKAKNVLTLPNKLQNQREMDISTFTKGFTKMSLNEDDREDSGSDVGSANGEGDEEYSNSLQFSTNDDYIHKLTSNQQEGRLYRWQDYPKFGKLGPETEQKLFPSKLSNPPTPQNSSDPEPSPVCAEQNFSYAHPQQRRTATPTYVSQMYGVQGQGQEQEQDKGAEINNAPTPLPKYRPTTLVKHTATTYAERQSKLKPTPPKFENDEHDPAKIQELRGPGFRNTELPRKKVQIPMHTQKLEWVPPQPLPQHGTGIATSTADPIRARLLGPRNFTNDSDTKPQRVMTWIAQGALPPLHPRVPPPGAIMVVSALPNGHSPDNLEGICRTTKRNVVSGRQFYYKHEIPGYYPPPTAAAANNDGNSYNTQPKIPPVVLPPAVYNASRPKHDPSKCYGTISPLDLPNINKNGGR